MIFRASSANLKKWSRKVRRVLKVNNLAEAVQKFEEYRDYVKKASSLYTDKEQQHGRQHPRSVVDGNELMQFYGTMMNCCGRKTPRVSQLCRDPTCRVCRVIRSGFDTSRNRMYGIRLGINSDVVSEDAAAMAKGKNVREAVIICRTIAGNVEKKYESVGKDQPLVLCNPSAVVPCFVVVFD